MPQGLQVFNEADQVIIDLNWPCFGLRQKVLYQNTTAVTVTVPVTGQQIPARQFTVTGVNPSVFHTGSAHLFSVSNSGNTWTFTYTHSGAQFPPTFYVFDSFDGIGPSTHGYGIESYAEDGRLLFSSMYPIMRFVHMSQLPNGALDGRGEQDPYLNSDGFGTGGYGTGGAYASTWEYHSLPANRTYAGALSHYRYGASSSSTTTDYGDALFEVLTMRADGFEVGGALQLGGESFGGFLGRAYDGRPPRLVLIDVTGF
ncbi:hypothetical protein [Stenotrophomonas maltophilia]|uniref:hypothetical protein n=1 Tax=Stenotrophomonas maltophilia TaxID=40324 RepID=UPI002E78709E|nr:hypothetical protein [Stenotrophomonas maltophilia]